jgi:hypothetical protein
VRRFAATGSPLSGEVVAGSVSTVGAPGVPAIASSAAGDFVVAWQSFNSNSTLYVTDVFARRFSAATVPLAPAFMANTYFASYQTVPTVAIAPGGDFVIAWLLPGRAAMKVQADRESTVSAMTAMASLEGRNFALTSKQTPTRIILLPPLMDKATLSSPGPVAGQSGPDASMLAEWAQVNFA